MQILLLLTDLFDEVGGIQTFNRCFVKALSDISIKKNTNIKIKILVLNDSGISSLASRYIMSKNIEYIFFAKNKFRFTASVLKESLVSNKIIFGHINFSPLLLIINMFNYTSEKMLIVHGTEVWKKVAYLKSCAIKKIEKILSVSAYTKEQMKIYNKTPEYKFIVFPNTLDPFYPAEPSVDEKVILPKGKIILSVTRLHPEEHYKNIDLVIKVLPEVLKSIPDTNYVIVGEGADRLRLELLAKELGVKNNVIFTGYVSENMLPLYYESSNVFILPSTGEGFGIVFLEAMYYSKPCIGANAGGIPEVIENRKTGFLVNPNDISSLSESIINLLKDNDLCYSMGKTGKERFERKFSFERFKERLENILCL